MCPLSLMLTIPEILHQESILPPPYIFPQFPGISWEEGENEKREDDDDGDGGGDDGGSVY